MAILIQKIENNSTANAPTGWLTIKDLEQSNVKEQKEKLREPEQSVSKYFPLAAKRVQKLIDQLKERLNMSIPLSYLKIENNSTFHVTMLVSQSTFLSPEMQAAKLLIAKERAEKQEFDMHYTFTVGSEFMLKNSMAPNSYEIRNIPEFEKDLQAEQVYLNQTG